MLPFCCQFDISQPIGNWTIAWDVVLTFQLNDKDLGMLEERIKRARAKPVAVVQPEPAAPVKVSGKGRPSTAPSQAAPRANSNTVQENR